MTPKELDDIRKRCEAASDDLPEIHHNLFFYRDELNKSLEDSPARLHELCDLLFLESAKFDTTALLAEVERLRDLIEQGRSDPCVWCQRFIGSKHRRSCPAFTPEGEVR